jgi:hypothetical protein
MKHLILLAIALSFSTSAFATKARLKALGSSLHLTDTQSLYASPYQVSALENFVSLESGKTTSTSSTDAAEASILTTLSPEAKLFFSFGHLDETVLTQRLFVNSVLTKTYKLQQNPLEVIYNYKEGSTVWAVGMYYSNFNNKLTSEKESSAGVRLAANYGDFKWKSQFGLVNTAVDAAGDSLDNNLYFNLGLRYNQNTLRYGLDVTTWGVSQTSAGAVNASASYQNILARLTQVNKTENGEYFVGISLDQTDIKNKMTDKKFTRLTAPLLIGAEAKANDWLTLRGSISQTVLVAQSKDEVGFTSAAVVGATGVVNGEFSAEANNTVMAVGTGVTLGKAQIDATLKGLVGSTASQNINGTDLLTQVGVIYKY